ncbi:MAG: xanthine dehydrogenase family protein molybdopterin-binding subunit [Lachnospiraceae bacterium]|nr:xanthine dehydrogenase family protein molybdopterin-binding subunit [Lachnospiraceae bacterium]
MSRVEEVSCVLRTVNQPLPKKDSMALVTGKPVFLDDVLQGNYLVVKVLRSPHANAMIEAVKLDTAKKVPGIEGIYTWQDVPDKRFTMAGQTYPEPSPYDRLLLDRHVRYVGDPVAIVAGKDEACVDRALKMIKVTYQVLPAISDFHQAKDNPLLVHPEENWKSLCPVGADNRRNLCASELDGQGDVEQVLQECDEVVEGTYHVKANQQAMMETFRTACYIDTYGRLNVISSTQIVFHARRIIAHALDIPQSKIRVTKPRIGGGFGAKQTVVAEIFPAFVTWKTGKPSKMIFSRYESQIASSPRHEMEVHVRIGAMRDGHIRAIDVDTLSDTGAYGEHGPTTVGLSGHKSIPLYGKLDAYRFHYDVVYTNHMSAGAYRGYGATQGLFAVETAVNELAARLAIDPVKLREMNMVRQGQIMPAYYGERTDSCALDRCLKRAAQMIGWEEKYPCRRMDNGKIRSVGMAMAMQGSGISGVDTGSAEIKLMEDGTYTLYIGSADMGTGCDTILAQMAAEVLECPLKDISVCAADTDSSPYDSGSYASSTTYVTGKAVVDACEKLKGQILKEAGKLLGIGEEWLEFEGTGVRSLPEAAVTEARSDAAGTGEGQNRGKVRDDGPLWGCENLHDDRPAQGCENLRDDGPAQGCENLQEDRPAQEHENASMDRGAPALEDRWISLGEIAAGATCGGQIALQAAAANSSPVSPPPFMVGMAEIELDPETGEVELLDYAAVVDCGTPINPNLARVQTEGGLVQGIGMALYENIQYTDEGRLRNNSFMQYKIPTRLDMGRLRVEFESSYEPTGPFGAKSIGEIVINTPAPALAHAIANATGAWLKELPFTSEKIYKAMNGSFTEGEI